jgi:hypothetical protein
MSNYQQFKPLTIDKITCFRCRKSLWDITSRDEKIGVWSDAIEHTKGLSDLKVKPCDCGCDSVILTSRGYLT